MNAKRKWCIQRNLFVLLLQFGGLLERQSEIFLREVNVTVVDASLDPRKAARSSLQELKRDAFQMSIASILMLCSVYICVGASV